MKQTAIWERPPWQGTEDGLGSAASETVPLSPPAGGELNPANNLSELRGVVSSEGLTGGSPTPQYLEWSM